MQQEPFFVGMIVVCFYVLLIRKYITHRSLCLLRTKYYVSIICMFLQDSDVPLWLIVGDVD